MPPWPRTRHTGSLLYVLATLPAPVDPQPAHPSPLHAGRAPPLASALTPFPVASVATALPVASSLRFSTFRAPAARPNLQVRPGPTAKPPHGVRTHRLRRCAVTARNPSPKLRPIGPPLRQVQEILPIVEIHRAKHTQTHHLILHLCSSLPVTSTPSASISLHLRSSAVAILRSSAVAKS